MKWIKEMTSRIQEEEMVEKFGTTDQNKNELLDIAESMKSYLESLEHCKEIAETALARMLAVASGLAEQ